MTKVSINQIKICLCLPAIHVGGPQLQAKSGPRSRRAAPVYVNKRIEKRKQRSSSTPPGKGDDAFQDIAGPRFLTVGRSAEVPTQKKRKKEKKKKKTADMTAVGSDDSDAVSKNDVLDGNIICHMILLQMNGSTVPRTSNRVSSHEVVSTDRTITQQGSPHHSLRNKKQQASKQAICLTWCFLSGYRTCPSCSLHMSTYEEFIMETEC